MDERRWIEARLSSVLDTLEFSLRSLSGRTISSAEIKTGTRTRIPSRSRRNRSEEFIRIATMVSPHSRFGGTLNPCWTAK
jgi:hypothetical protein